mgnify:CR=1 FL=1
MSKLYNTAKKFLFGGPKTYGTGAIKSVTPNIAKTVRAKKEAEHKINMAKIPGKVFHRYKNIGKLADSMNREGRKMKQYLRGEKETYSGVSKGKDLKGPGSTNPKKGNK